MAVIDIHCHIYPDKIADRATQSVGEFYHAPMQGGGSVQGLLEQSAASPITHHLVHSVAVKASTVESINSFIAQSCAQHENFIGFAAMHPDYPNMEAELDRVQSLGLVGVKLHPDTQAVNMDDPRLMRLYEAMERRGMPLLVHTGDYRYDYSHPRRLVNVLHSFPRLVVNAAHFGGWSIFDLGFEILEHERCFVDTSSAMHWLGPRRTRELCALYGFDRVLFGADYPMWNPAKEYERFVACGFTPAQLERMTWRNAEEYLGRSL